MGCGGAVWMTGAAVRGGAAMGGLEAAIGVVGAGGGDAVLRGSWADAGTSDTAGATVVATPPARLFLPSPVRQCRVLLDP